MSHAAPASDPAPDPFYTASQLEGVPSAFSSARDGIDAVLRDRGLRRSTPEDTALSLLRGAAATSKLEGGEGDVDVLANGGGDAIGRAAVRLNSELLSLVPVWQRSPVQAIARIHALAASGSVSDEELGRPASADGVARLSELARRVLAPTKAPALVVAALVHAEIADAAAFVSHNAMVARAAERLVLVARGLDPASVTVPEAGHAADEVAYRAGLSGYSRGDTVGVHQWLLYAPSAYAKAAELSPLAR